MYSSRKTAVGTRLADREENPPIPLLKRHVILNLGGDWHLKMDPEDVGEAEGWFKPGAVRGRRIPVPAPWQFVFEDLRHYIGSVWYERSFTIPEKYKDRRIAVVFVSVDYQAKVWVNGEPVGQHVGGYSPFALDISAQVRGGQENTITVNVTDQEWVDFNENNHWNVHISGIWRDVWVEETGKAYISDIHIIPDVDASMARVWVKVNAPAMPEKELGLQLLVKAPEGQAFAIKGELLVSGSEAATTLSKQFDVAIENPVLWDVENPVLYEVEARLLSREGEVVDVASTDFGMRKIEVKGARIYLNGKPVYLFGGFPFMHELNISPKYQHPTDEDIQRQIMQAKELGMNFIRSYGNLEDPRYLYWADRLGILLMLSPPSMHQVTEESLQRWRHEWRALIIRDRNHPSVLIWSSINESMGLYYDENWELLPGAMAREILERAYEEAKELDPSRPTIGDSSGVHIKGDIRDAHPYYKLSQYENCRRDMESVRTLGRPYLITEFGPHIMLPDLDRLKAEWGEKPWWMEESTRLKKLTGYEHSCVHPAGYEERFHKWGLDEVYGAFSNMVDKNGWFILAAIKYQIEQIRKNPDISGYTYTDMSDNPGAHTGLIDYWREKKPWSAEYAKLQTPDLIFIDWSRLNFWSGDVFKGQVYVSHLSRQSLRGCTVKWWLEGSVLEGEIQAVSVRNFDVERVGEIEFSVPAVEEGTKARLFVALKKDEQTISQNYVDLCFFPTAYRQPTVKQKINVPLWQSLGSFGQGNSKVQAWKGMGWEASSLTYRLGMAGYEVFPGLDPDIPLAIVTTMDDEVEAYLANGGTVLLIETDSGSQDFLSRFGLKLATEAGGPCESQFVRKSGGLFERIPFDNPLLWPFYRVFASKAILGLRPEHNRDILAGYFGHYITFQVREDAELHGVGATLTQLRFKQGRLLITTFDLFRTIDEDPVAAIMLQDLVSYALNSFEPQTVLEPPSR